MARKIGAILAGMVVVSVVVFAMQALSARLHPLPPGIDPLDPADSEALLDHLSTMPAISWALAFSSELVGAFLGALVAGWIARPGPSTNDISGHGARRSVRLASGTIVLFALAASIFNWTAFAHPTWFMVGQLAGYPLVLLGAWTLLGKRRSAIAP
jgi:hypothetical protein